MPKIKLNWHLLKKHETPLKTTLTQQDKYSESFI